MDKITHSLETVVQAIADEARLDLGAHPSLDQLADHRAGRLSAADRDRVQEHLALCHSCTELLLDLASFPRLEPPQGAEPMSELAVERAWRDMSPGLLAAAGIETPGIETPGIEPHEDDAAATPTVVGFPDLKDPGSNRPARALLVAAMLLVTAGSLWIGALYKRLADQSAPQYAAVIDIDTARASRTYPVSPNAGQLLLIVKNFDLETYSRGRLQISRGGTVVRSAELEPAPDDRSLLYLVLPRDLLPAGPYRIKIFGLETGGEQLLKDIGLTLEDQD